MRQVRRVDLGVFPWSGISLAALDFLIDLTGPTPTSGTFIAATEGEHFSILREKAAKRAKARGWAVHTVEGPHPLQETSPSKEKVAEILLEIASRES